VQVKRQISKIGLIPIVTMKPPPLISPIMEARNLIMIIGANFIIITS